MPHETEEQRPLTRDLPLSLVLGAGGVRGMAHFGVLQVLEERGYRISEMVGTSVGALIIGFYAAVGMDLDELEEIGRGTTTRHLLAWAWLRRAPASIERRWRHRAGRIPECLDRLAGASWAPLHHGVERIGMVSYDLERCEEILGHSAQRELSVEEAARGAAALPGIFPARRCEMGGRRVRLTDGGVVNRLPANRLFDPPFRPAQVLAVDISNTVGARRQNLDGIARLRSRHPDVPIEVVYPDTLGKATILYRSSLVQALVDSGRRAAEAALDRAVSTSAAPRRLCSAPVRLGVSASKTGALRGARQE